MNNIILIGHKGAGKTTYGKQLAEQLGYTFVDVDDLILKMTHYSTVADCYSAIGEESFRTLEQRAIAELHGERQIIATGGGVILREANMLHLKKLGKIVYLSTDFNTLCQRNANRPRHGILKTLSRKKFKERAKWYEHYADEIIKLKTHENDHG